MEHGMYVKKKTGVICQVQAQIASPLEKKRPVPNEQDVVWSPEPVSMLWRREKSCSMP
jgi:hypothetical protein